MAENEDVFVFASRIVTNAPIEPKFRLELRNTPKNRMLLNLWPCKQLLGLNFQVVSHVKQRAENRPISATVILVNFHFIREKGRGFGTLLLAQEKLNYSMENCNKIKRLINHTLIMPMLSVLVKFQPRKSLGCHLIVNWKLLPKSCFRHLIPGYPSLEHDIGVKTRSTQVFE